MMEPQIVVPSMEGGETHRAPALGREEALTTSQKPLHEVPVVQKRPEDQSTRPLKQLVNPDSLYKYLSWEDPARTVGSYVVVMAVLFGAHYLPLTQTALKTGATILGGVATVEFAHRSFTPNTLLARLRPKEYRKVPEPILNDTLKDVHDLVQYTVVMMQRIVYGEELEKTFAGFVSLAVLYWLVKVVSPFGLAVLGVHVLYIAPIIKSRQGREVLRNAKARAGDLSNAAIENAQTLANSSREKATELSSQAQATAQDAQRRLGEMAQSGSQTAADVSSQVKDKVSGISGNAAENVSKVPQMGRDEAKQASDASASAIDSARNTIGHTSENAASTLDNAKQNTSSALPDTLNQTHTKESKSDAHDNDHSSTAALAEPSSDLLNTTHTTVNDHMGNPANMSQRPAVDVSAPAKSVQDTVGQLRSAGDVGDSHYELKSTSEGLKDATDSTPRHFAGTTNPFFKNMKAKNRAEGDQAGTTGIMGRPRAIPPADIDGSPVFGKFNEPGL